MNKIKCKHANEYKGIRAPTCGCETCNKIWETSTSKGHTITVAQGRKRKVYTIKPAICEVKTCGKSFKTKAKFPTKYDGLIRCHECRNEHRRTHYSNQEKYKKRRRDWQLKKEYGITQDDYDLMLKSQGGECKICLNPPKKTTRDNQKLVVDHDHATGKVRGLLCQDCNRGLGVFKDSDFLLEAARNYIKSYNERTDK
jgi:hypothetical protein